MFYPRTTLLRPLHFLARPTLMFFALPWLMALLVLGTVAQRYIGLYASQKLFFGSFLLWVGYVPLPGAYATLALIAASLLAKLLLKSRLALDNTGTLLVHVSAIILLVGGLITALGREDGYMVLGDGDSAAAVSDYRARDLIVIKNGVPVLALPLARMHQGAKVDASVLPFKITVSAICFPCSLATRPQLLPAGRGLAQKLELVEAPYGKDDAQNLSGIAFVVNGEGEHIALERLDAADAVAAGADSYSFAIRPEERPLPFAITLEHFTRTDYPGTDEARAYRSDVTVKDNGLAWNAAIQMNRPLRYKGYTLYQSSYVEDGGRVMSVFAVVKNAGVWFPYAAITMLCLGLLLHMLLLLRDSKRTL